jgi:hypothetical protein
MNGLDIKYLSGLVLEGCEMLVKFSTLGGGVYIEVTDSDERKASDRCFRFDSNGNSKYAMYWDLISTNPHPRWYTHLYTIKDFSFA